VDRESGKIVPLPEQLPNRVELVLRRPDPPNPGRGFVEPHTTGRGMVDVLPLFPYRITYRRVPAANRKAAKSAADAGPRELLTLEMFKVSNDEKRIDLSAFRYQPGDQDAQNLTTYYIQRFSGGSKLR
jgi:hypothetical protein